MFSFKIKNTRLKFHISFLIGIILVQEFFDETLVIYFFSACVIHELGHIFTFILLGEKLSDIEFTLSGMVIKPENILCCYKKDILILLAGPAFNIISGVLCFFENREMAIFYIITGLFHFMPFQKLDGGRIIYSVLLEMVEYPQTAGRICKNLNIVFSLLLLIVLFIFEIKNIWIYLFILFNMIDFFGMR